MLLTPMQPLLCTAGVKSSWRRSTAATSSSWRARQLLLRQHGWKMQHSSEADSAQSCAQLMARGMCGVQDF